jgi:Leucine-rich repeat (LRR) protein
MIELLEEFMKFTLRNNILPAVFSLLVFSGIVSNGFCTNPASDIQQKDEKQAVAELTKLGVPLQKDPKGNVRWIEARQGELNDKALSLLPSLPDLEWLEIGNGIITPDGMKHLGKCTSLKRLYVHDINLMGAELEWLSGLDKLTALSLQHTKINGKFLRHLKAVDSLKVLNLSGDSIADDDMARIARFKNLEVLALEDTEITGSGINELEGMARLNELNIGNCAIQDHDLSIFLSMPNLRIVYAEGCNLSDFAIGNIVAKFPTLAIFR